ncbi:cache domain-containing sensor histidine kinase [Paenibacillus elgii]|uniref:cache domain-containing sensor histidine kinase n=1 Tax=Paenibacillus elgii TaxID=189691 RepID=UPI000FDB4BD6|nr:sensor histidine kinase [Paenibacillus elgii]NEN86822.1 sensor histidine kinase [Paenibacillus elgii]
MALRNMSFRLKMFVIMFIVILIPMILVSTILFKWSEQAITDQTSKVVISSIEFAVTNIDSALENVAGMSKMLLTENRLIAIAKRGEPLKPEEKHEKYNGIMDLLSFFITRIKVMNILEGIDSFYLYLVKQNTIMDSKSTYYEDVNVDHVDFVQQAKSGQWKDRWFVSAPVNYDSLNGIETRLETAKQISFTTALSDEDGHDIAVLAANVNESFISDYYKKIQRGIPGEFVVLDQSSTVVACPDNRLVGSRTSDYTKMNDTIQNMKSKSGSFFITVQGEEKFAVYSVSDYTNWSYVVVIPASEILGKVNEMQKFMLIVISVTGILIFGITLLLSRFFYKPLEKLVLAMQKIENRRLDFKIKDNRGDEYKRVYQGFNDMVDELNVLIRDLENEKILNQEAEIKLLQAQINPHFLYNTLDSIYSIARIKKVDEISQMVAALSKFFRISLSSGKEVVALKEAVQLVINYLTILNIRYKGAITFELDIPEELYACQVPKLLLQPIVENTVYHGLERRKGGGQLTISAVTQSHALFLYVEDDGIGIEPAALDKLQSMLSGNGPGESSSFALRNLNRQIRLKYGMAYGVTLESVYGQGTRVTVKLPVITMERGDSDVPYDRSR